MKQLIKKTNRKVMAHREYGGVCHSCNSPVAYDGEMVVVEIENTNEYWLVVPIDLYECPYCSKPVEIMRIYKSLDVSEELRKIDA